MAAREAPRDRRGRISRLPLAQGARDGAEAVSKLATTSLKSTIKKVNLDQNWNQEDAIESIHKIFSDAGLDSVLQSLEDNDPDGEPEEDEADEVANLIAKLTV